jgi:hypothetical protein
MNFVSGSGFVQMMGSVTILKYESRENHKHISRKSIVVSGVWLNFS